MAENIHFRILEDIARDLSGDINFPTCLDAAVLVRNTLKDPYANIERVAQAVGVEPLISSKLLRLANSAAYNRSGSTISDLASGISRLGFEVVRTTSLAVAMDQMLKSRHLAAYDQLARKTWEYSIQVAAIARVLARRLGRVNPDEAMLAGLVHKIGVFYLLYRAAEYPEYRNNEAGMIELIAGWHESIGESLLHILGLPDRIIDALNTHQEQQAIETPCSVRDVLYFARLLANDKPDWDSMHDDRADERTASDRARYADLLEEAAEDIFEIRAVLVG
jgi:HD-like signal output (HDOD) protein